MYTVFLVSGKVQRNIETSSYGYAISTAYGDLVMCRADRTWVVDSSGKTVYVAVRAKGGSIQERMIS